MWKRLSTRLFWATIKLLERLYPEAIHEYVMDHSMDHGARWR